MLYSKIFYFKNHHSIYKIFYFKTLYSIYKYVRDLGRNKPETLSVDCCRSGLLFLFRGSYLFGKDPKMMPPPFRLTKEMVEAMGGMDAPHYTVFKSLCCQVRCELYITEKIRIRGSLRIARTALTRSCGGREGRANGAKARASHGAPSLYEVSPL